MDPAIPRAGERGPALRPPAAREERAYRTVTVDSAAGLADHAGAWNDLARCAIEPNPFHEPWFLLPALEAFAKDAALQFALVYADTEGGQPELCGFFPLERASRFRGFPAPHLRLWRPVHAYLGTPLVRRGCVHAAIAALHDWLATGAPGGPVMEWGWVTAGGEFHAALRRVQDSRGLATLQMLSETRALLTRHPDPERYLAESLSAKSRKELRRLERRLAEAGTVERDALDAEGDVERWIADFLALEASGWKGRNASALGSSAASRRFFIRAASEAARHGKLEMTALRLEGRAIAMHCGFVAGEGSFAFKIAFDEAFARFSPGLLLEIDHVRRFHAQRDVAWMDSCAAPGHFMAERLWQDRRTLVTELASTGRFMGNFAIAALAFARRGWRFVRRGP